MLERVEKGVRTFLEGAYFAMPMVAPSFIESGDKIFWLLDSGSSYHVVSRATLESGHVKVLSRKKRPKTVRQTATGDLVEVGSDTHATIEVNFLTTRPIEKREGVLSTFACTCRLEAVVSDEIKHNLINLSSPAPVNRKSKKAFSETLTHKNIPQEESTLQPQGGGHPMSRQL